MPRKASYLVVALLLLLLGPGCVSVVVNSMPMGADVYVDGKLVGQTPCKFKAKTIVGCGYEVVVKKEGFKDFKTEVDAEFDPYTLFMLLSPLIVLIPFLGTVVPREVYAVLERAAEGWPSPR